MSFSSLSIPTILGSKEKNANCPFNILITKEFVGEKVEPELTEDIVRIYKEIAGNKKVVDDVKYEFSHGDFAPWNIKKNGNQYTVFDWEHCGYRVEGFDLMHYATIVEMVVRGKTIEEAYISGLENINAFEPSFTVDRKAFLDEFTRLRKQIG